MFLIFELKCVCRNEVSRGEAVSISTILSNSTLFEYYLTVEILDSDRLSEILSISCCSESLQLDTGSLYYEWTYKANHVVLLAVMTVGEDIVHCYDVILRLSLKSCGESDFHIVEINNNT